MISKLSDQELTNSVQAAGNVPLSGEYRIEVKAALGVSEQMKEQVWELYSGNMMKAWVLEQDLRASGGNFERWSTIHVF